MKNRQNLPRLLLSVLLLLIFSAALFPAPAHAAAPKTIKVAYYYDGVFLNKSDDGVYGGYDVEYLYEIAKYTDWTYQFVDFDSFDDAYAALESGEVDVIADMFKTEEREKTLLFSAESMGHLYVTLIVPSGDTIHSYNDYASFAGMHVGVLAGSVDGDNVRSWNQQNNLGMTITEMDSVEGLLGAMKAGTLDGVGITYLGMSSDYRVAAEFDPQYFYFGTLKKNTELMNELNTAMEQISIRNPGFASGLFNKYFSAEAGDIPAFTAEEQAYIAGAGTVRVAVPENNPPFSYRDDSGELTGAVVDLFSRYSELSGLKFELVPAADEQACADLLNSGSVQAAGEITENAMKMASQGIKLTDPYLRLSLNQVTRKNDASSDTGAVAVPESVLSTVSSDSLFASRTLVYYSSPQQCIAALNTGRATAAVASDVYTNYLLNHSRSSEYSVSLLSGYSCDMTIGTDVSDTALFSVLNKCVQDSDSALMDGLVQKYSLAADDSPVSFLNRVPANVLIVYAVVLVGILIALAIAVILLIRHTRRERELAAAQERVRQEAKLSAERTEFFGTVSHDMRTPLNGILGFADLALESPDTAVREEYLKKIRSSGRLLLDLVNDTLVIARTQSERFELHPAPADNIPMLEDVITPIRVSAGQKGVIFRADISRAYRGWVMVDRLSRQKIFLNLLSNATKFTPPGGTVELLCEYFPPDKNGYSTKAVIRDSGVGMSAEYLPHMFELFSQEHPAGADGHAGTGMGLSIVRRLVDAMHGKIDVKSEKGKGTEFTVWLPLEILPDYRPEQKKQTTAPSLAGKKILLCEDNAVNTEIAKLILEHSGMTVVCAADGREGADAFAASAPGEFSAILMDLRMPVLNGYESAAEIRAMDRPDAATVPILALSADAYEEDIQKAKAAGMNAHLAKPVDPDKLLAALSGCIGA